MRAQWALFGIYLAVVFAVLAAALAIGLAHR